MPQSQCDKLRFAPQKNGAATYFAVKPDNISKVVDENGEPLVVYHGGGTRTPVSIPTLRCFMGCAKIDGKPYRVKTRLKRYKTSGETT